MSSISTEVNPLPILAGVLTSPRETFKATLRTPSWLAPIIIAILIGMIGNAFYYWRVNPDWEHRVRSRMEQHRVTTGQAMSPDQIAQQVATARMFGRFFIVIPAISIPLFCIVVAVLYWLTFGLTFLGAPPFKTFLSVVAWSKACMSAVGVPMLIIVLLAIDSEELERIGLENSKLVQSNLSALLPAGISPAIKSLASSLDLFTIWFLVLLTIGFASVVGLGPKRISTWKTAALVFSVWGAWAGINATLALIFGF